MSNNQNRSEGIPGWAKVLIAIGGVGAAIITVYYVITNVFGAGVNAYKQLYQQQWNALMQKMANYIKENGTSQTGFTPSQQQAITQEENILQQTQQGLTAAANGVTNALMWTMMELGTAAIIGGAAVYTIINYWKIKNGGKAASTYGYTYSVTRAIADELSQMGYITQAVNVINSSKQMFRTIDQPAMTEQINSLQMSLATLTGVELLAAQQMISLLSLDLAAVPAILVTPIII